MGRAKTETVMRWKRRNPEKVSAVNARYWSAHAEEVNRRRREQYAAAKKRRQEEREE